jgi:pimeloyl-ACP methyl ester carboxylesterase
MPFLESCTVKLYFEEKGSGIPFFFQHGLGGDISQPFGLFHPPPGIRLIAFDCRGHGQSSLGPKDQLHLSTFADDLLALMNYLEIPSAIVGGISMGAAVALDFVTRHPTKVIGLVLSRPAWLDQPNPFNVHFFSFIADLIKEHGSAKGLEKFRATGDFAAIQASYPDTANSLQRQFLNPRAQEFCEVLSQIPKDHGQTSREAWSKIAVPTLVLANKQDPIHPFDYGTTIASLIPGAEFQQLVSKSMDVPLHEQQVQSFLETFLATHFLCARPRWYGRVPPRP